ncbi:MAG: J domain-containing protein [Bryobacterales bacterium]|nr:J domain-containing protein [Bryobacterales bacterium]
MASKHDYYKTLGLERGASADEVRKSYRRLARKNHPDLYPFDITSEDKFKNVQEAYDVISDDKKRQMYDKFGFYSDQGFPAPGGPGQAGGFGFGGFDFGDLFGQAAGGAGPRGAGMHGHPGPHPDEDSGFGNLFSQFFSRGKQKAKSPERGQDLEYALNIDFWQSIKGTQVRLTINRQETCGACHGSGSAGGATVVCPECNGSGSVTQMAGAMKFSLTCNRCQGSGKAVNACPVCLGEGRTAQPESVEVRIPQGARNGSRLRVAAKGSAGTLGAPAGDLYITIRVEDHRFFHRDGDDILIQVPVSISEAYLGGKIEVPTIDGRALLKIPPGTQTGQKFRLREKGVFNARTATRGDQIVEVQIAVPKTQDEHTREIFRQLAALHPDDPRAEIWKET